VSRERIDGRSVNELRKVEITKNINPYAAGSVIVSFGNTKVHVTASLEKKVPRWFEDDSSGWVSAEYGMLPGSTHSRNRREASAGKQSGRTLEIQRLIARSLRASLDLNSIPGITIQIDCDVLIADGGTRTASISGAWVALADAVKHAHQSKMIPKLPEMSQIAAVSVGVCSGVSLLDLCYAEDSKADFDLNLVFNDKGEVVEIQGTAEGNTLSPKIIHDLTLLGWEGSQKIIEIQQESLSS